VTAFLKIDRCDTCGRDLAWEWTPPIVIHGAPLAGTGVWKSQLIEGKCPACFEAARTDAKRQRRLVELNERLIRLLGNKPLEAYTFERYEQGPGNRVACEAARGFDPVKHNLYLWGNCGVGKTHLAFAITCGAYRSGHTIAAVTPAQLIRKLRMKPPEEEQSMLENFATVEVLMLDDLGLGGDTAYGRQVIQEILDARDHRNRTGLIVTSQYSPARLAVRMNDNSIPSRLTGMCKVIEIRGVDRRWVKVAAR
jgi:DNA replication protein DnaC